jgi:S-adenosyl-L-methionine hydrolase (adenosine-forming)
MTAGPGRSRLITLLTDFGLSDPFVGIMKGVIWSVFPGAQIVDLCHGIQPQAVAEAAFWLERSYVWFPPGSVHVAVVDPTVGSTRRIVALASRGHTFLAPDNGLLARSLLGAADARAYALDLARLGMSPASATFHGRDVFAPVAARLASGALALEALGDPLTPQPCVLEEPQECAEHVAGVVVTVDRFGNLITNLDATLLERTNARRVTLGGRDIPILRTYADAAPGELLAVVNAFGVIEVAEREGNAERRLGLGRGTPVELPLSELVRA